MEPDDSQGRRSFEEAISRSFRLEQEQIDRVARIIGQRQDTSPVPVALPTPEVVALFVGPFVLDTVLRLCLLLTTGIAAAGIHLKAFLKVGPSRKHRIPSNPRRAFF